ncbi:MAG: archaellin/type IV pilin N-terminal domain-containing protein [Thermoproteota archaeon]
MARRLRGIVGIESAIVMIAFVIVAAALAFVVLNMGFFTTQQSKSAIQRGLGEASSAVEIDGTVVAHVDTSSSAIDYWFANLKLSAGQHRVDLTPMKTIVGYWSPEKGVALSNTYLVAVLTPIHDPKDLVQLIESMMNDSSTTISGSKGQSIQMTYSVGSNNYKVVFGLPEDVSNMTLKDFFGNYTGGVVSVIAWVTKTNEDTVLDPGEKVLFLVYYSDSTYMPTAYDHLKAELKVPVGAPLTIERMVPPSLSQAIVDLG